MSTQTIIRKVCYFRTPEEGEKKKLECILELIKTVKDWDYYSVSVLWDLNSLGVDIVTPYQGPKNATEALNASSCYGKDMARVVVTLRKEI